MARFFAALAVLAVLIQAGESSTPNGEFNSPSVVCNSLGFQPSFTYSTENEEHDLVIEVDIGGSGNSNNDCVAMHNDSSLNGTKEFTYSDFAGNDGSQISYQNSNGTTMCGGTFEHWIDLSSNSTEYIRYQVNVSAIVTRTFRGKIERKTQYPFVITCLLNRVLDGVSTNNSFEVQTQLVDAADTATANDTFTFDASIKFHFNASYDNELTDLVVRPKNNERLYLKVSQGADQDFFKFVVNKCYATDGSTVPVSDTDAKKDVFFENQCHVDETVVFAQSGKDFQFSILSFSFPNPSGTIFFHCDLYVCLDSNNTASCTQKSQNDCNAQARRRRSVEGVDYDYAKTITAAQPILLEASQVDTPSCGEGFVYDREFNFCSRENLLEVQNVRLSQDTWRKEYANTSSSAFKDLAKTKEFQLWVLLMTTGQNSIIHGVKVLRARPGSVIMDLVIRYSDSVTAEQAFSTFRKVLYTPSSTTRVQKILQISHEKNIEYVPFMPRGSAKTDTEKLILIVVVVVLFVVLLIAGVTFFKVKQMRQAPTTQAAKGFDNKGVDA